MHLSSYLHMQELVAKYLPAGSWGRVLDIGSQMVEGQKLSYRKIFETLGWEYVGLDVEEGLNVDAVAESPEVFPFEGGTFDLVISGQALEHIPHFWETFKEIERVLKPEGSAFIIAPSRGPEHRYPVDCWRFYPDGYRALAEWAGLELIEVETDWTPAEDPDSSNWGDTVGVFRKAAGQTPYEDTSGYLAYHLNQLHVPDQVSSNFWKGLVSHLNAHDAPDSSWYGHRLFAHWLIFSLEPSRFVELGTYQGSSYFAFCDAVKSCGKPCRCHAVDVWSGDKHVGFYSGDAYDYVSRVNRERYGSFSELLKMEFDSAVARFEDKSIDLLHIDGLHTYEAVRHDFMTWLPKMSDTGIIIMHDIAEKGGDFGVWKFWEELKRSYCTFAFEHSSGLGVVAVGDRIPEGLEQMLTCRDHQPVVDAINSLFLGCERLVLQQRDRVRFPQARLMLDTGLGFSERDSLVQARLADSVCFRFDAATVHKARFVPCDEPCIVTLRGAKAFSLDERLIDLTLTANSALTVNDNTFFFNTGSPEIVFDAGLRTSAILVDYTVTLLKPGPVLDMLASIADYKADGEAAKAEMERAIASAREEITRLNKIIADMGAQANSAAWNFKAQLEDTKKMVWMTACKLFTKQRTYPWRKHLKVIRKSGLFDAGYYLAGNPDVAETGVDPLEHFVKCGWYEFRNPSPLFDINYYLSSYEDVLWAFVNPFLHYVEHGRNECRAARYEPAAVCDTRGQGEFKEPIPYRGDDPLAKIIAFYLPQFHPIPENDKWWGEGFTEWTNVTKASPLFPGHYQPRLPGPMGFYDLRVPEVLAKQAEMAKKFGVHGFCFHHYYFAGKRLLEKPVDNLLAHPEIDMPFMLCWANENWTRRWDGLEEDILISQAHSPEDDIRFIKDIARYFEDSRYIRVDGKPAFILYKAIQLPDAQATLARWREYWQREKGEGLYIIMAQTFGEMDPLKYGFDAAVEFPPHAPYDAEGGEIITSQIQGLGADFSGLVMEYDSMLRVKLPEDANYQVYRTVFPSWDCTARKGARAQLFYGDTPASYAKWLTKGMEHAVGQFAADHSFCFVNAWNEWAEGACLEPDKRFGYRYLNATARALEIFSAKGREYKIAVLIHCYYLDTLEHLLVSTRRIPAETTILLSVPRGNGDEARQILDRLEVDNAVLKEVENVGYDIGPMFCAFGEELFEYDLVCKIHSKKSVHESTLGGWRSFLLDHMFGDATSVVNEFMHDRELGMLYPPTYPPIKHFIDNLGASMDQAKPVLKSIGAGNVVEDSFPFPTGSFFWFRPESLRLLFDRKYDLCDFQPGSCACKDEKSGKVIDQTLAHALERSFCYAARLNGYTTKIIDGSEYIDDGLKVAAVGSLETHCPVCEAPAAMRAENSWLRDYYRCMKCSSLPRDRALFKVLHETVPDWKTLEVLEFAPCNEFVSGRALKYTGSQYYPDKPMGEVVDGFVNQDAHDLTFGDDSFDVILHLDVFEHLLNPEKALQEMVRVLRPGGHMVFTVPVWKDLVFSRQRAALSDDGTVRHYLEAHYHGNPVSEEGALVTWDYGQDFGEMLKRWCEGDDVDIQIINEVDKRLGIDGEFLDVVLIRKK